MQMPGARAHGASAGRAVYYAARRDQRRRQRRSCRAHADRKDGRQAVIRRGGPQVRYSGGRRSEEHTSELQSLMRISYAVFCLKKKNIRTTMRKVISQTLTMRI